MKKDKIKISAVSYLNTLPFLYGLNNSGILDNFVFELDIPSICAKKLIDDQVDIALIPVAGIPYVKNPVFISNYCLGAYKQVKSVILFSDVPLEQIESVYLDYQSRTSVNLVQVLALKHWKINPKWINSFEGFETEISGRKAGVIIGDRTFSIKKDYKYVYDLSMEWYNLTGLPFVFATWVANKPIYDEFVDQFNRALQFGLDHIDLVVKEYVQMNPDSKIDLKDYLTNNISYLLDEPKKKSIKLFYQYMIELGLLPTDLVQKISLF